MKYPFPVKQNLSDISIAYTNREMIADRVLPTAPVTSESFKYNEYPIHQGFTLPDTQIGRRGKANYVEFEAIEKTASTEDHALRISVPQKDIDEAELVGASDPEEIQTEYLTELMVLRHEVSVAEAVLDPAIYGPQTEVVAAADKWNDPASSPLDHLLSLIDQQIMRPNKIVLPGDVFTALRRHPQIVSSINRNSGDKGRVTLSELRELLEVDEILVGRALANVADLGQPAQLAPAWVNHVALLYTNEVAARARGATFGFVARRGERMAGSTQIRAGELGLKGGVEVIVGEQRKPIICAPGMGYLIQTPL